MPNGDPISTSEQRGVLLSEQQVSALVNSVVKRYTGREIEPGSGLGRFQALCANHVPVTWFGPCQSSSEEARADAAAHIDANPGHQTLVIGPMICEENE